MGFHLGLQRFFIVWSQEFTLLQPASTSLVSWPVTATISRHLLIKAAQFLPSLLCDSLSGRAMTAPRLLIGHFPANIPEWLTSSFGTSRFDFSYSICGQFWDRPQLCNFDLYFFRFCCCFFPTDPKTLNCFLVSVSSKELGNAPRAELLCQHVYVWMLTYSSTERGQTVAFVFCVVWFKTPHLQIWKSLFLSLWSIIYI